jgi:D-alanine-D-alanine ligase-like ATP-grasp enzyme
MSAIGTRLLTALSGAGRPGRVLAPELDQLRTLGLRRTLRGRGGRAPAEDERRLSECHSETYLRIWRHAADALGAELHELGDGFLRISLAGKETIVRRHLVTLNGPSTEALSLDKSLVHRLLAREGVPIPEHLETDRDDRVGALAFLRSSEQPCVVKPANGTSGGTGVTCGVSSRDQLWRAWLRAARWDKRLLIERETPGEEYRLLFLDGELLDAVQRRRPRVVGDGEASVLGLIARENERRLAAGSEDVSRLLHVDLDCELAVRAAGLTLRSVPARGQVVIAKSTVSENASSENSTVSDLGPELVAEARRAVELLHLRLGGIDLVTPDRSRSLSAAGGTILEINATPGFHYHRQVDNPADAVAVAIPILKAALGSS